MSVHLCVPHRLAAPPASLSHTRNSEADARELTLSLVTVQTPSGAVKKSSYYQNGHFHLLVDNPVEGGKYVCRIPLLANACLRSNSRSAVGASLSSL